MNTHLKLSTRDAQGNPNDQASNIATRLKEISQRGGLRREATFGEVDLEARTVELSFSSETDTVHRWFGIEILSHDATAANLTRLNNGAPVLWMHDWNDQRGVVEQARIDADRKGRAVLRFSRSEAGEQLMQDVADKIITKVSVGYLVDGMKLIEERDDEDVFLVTSWTPYEISMVSVPADDTVGVGRTAEIPQEEKPGKPADNPTSIKESAAARVKTEDQRTMKYRTFRDAQGNLCRVAVDDAGTDVGTVEIIERAGAERAAGQEAERVRVRELMELGRAYNAVDKAAKFAEEGKTADDLRRELLHDFAAQRGNRPLSEQTQDANIGLSDKEVRQFSIMRAIRAMADPQDRTAREAAAFEFEASAAAAQRYGKSPKGIIIPNDVLARDFSTTAPAGGPGHNIVATNLLAGSFIELLRKKAWVMRRARTLAGLVGNVDIPRQNASTQAYWVGEGGAPNKSEPGVDQIAFTPKTVGAYTDITRRLMLQATPDAEALVRDDLLKVMALEIDRVAIYGSGSTNQPLGVKNQTGINAVDFATAGKPTFAEIVDMETQIALDNADVDSMSYAFNAGIRGYMKTALKFPDTAASGTIWEQGNTVNGYAADVSNQVASGDVFFGNWQDLVIAMWGGLELTVDPYSLSTSGGLRLVALQDVDMNVRHKESFCYGSDTVA